MYSVNYHRASSVAEAAKLLKDDAKLLSDALPSLGVAIETVRVSPDAARSRGSLRIETDIGVLDADLAPQLDRLALKLRESLAHGE